ncbi:MAG: 4Fe-4S dicluster domain-containing protein [archaeon]|nr:4Fe-4S dicluster domain-containing protein [archaeon]
MSKLTIEETPLDFAESIINDIKSSKENGVLKCVQCGMCTSTCPAARHSDYNPRDMIQRVLEGDMSIVEDDSIWNCFYCYTCHSICPVGNSACEVNQILKQFAISKGINIDKISQYSEFGDSYLTKAIGGIPSVFFDDIREDVGEDWWEFKLNLDNVRDDLGLAPVYPPQEVIDEVGTLLVNCGFKERLDKIKQADNNSDLEINDVCESCDSLESKELCASCNKKVADSKESN